MYVGYYHFLSNLLQMCVYGGVFLGAYAPVKNFENIWINNF